LNRFYLIHALVLAGLCLAAFWAYRYAVIAIPRSDQSLMVAERHYAGSDFRFVWNSLVFNRMRHGIHPEGIFTWRPGFFLLSALRTVFLSNHPALTGGIFILVHGLIAFAIYLFIAARFGRKTGLLLAVFFLFQFPGLEMVYWRHISPYLLCLLFVLMALNLLGQNETGGQETFERKTRFGVVFALFCATLFHEIAIVSTVLLAGLILLGLFLNAFVFRGAFPQGRFWGKRWLGVCAAVLLLSGLANFRECFHALSTFGHRYGSAGHPAIFLDNSVMIGGYFFTAFFLPWKVRLRYDSDWERFLWDFEGVSKGTVVCGGLVILALIAVVILIGVRHFCRGKGRRAVPEIFCGLLYGTLILALAYARGLNYLTSATYYYYYSNALTLLCLVLVARAFLPGLPAIFRKKAMGKAMAVLLCVFCFAQIFYGQGRLDALLAPRFQEDKKAADLSEALIRTIRRHPDSCIGGSAVQSFWELVPVHTVTPYICQPQGAQKPLYVTYDEGGQYWFSRLVWTEPVEELWHGELYGGELSMAKAASDRVYFNFAGILPLKGATSPPFLFRAKFKRGSMGGLVIGLRDQANYVGLIVLNRFAIASPVAAGLITNPLAVGYLLDPDLIEHDYVFSLRKIEGRYYAFLDENLQLAFDNVSEIMPVMVDAGFGIYGNPEVGKNYFSDVLFVPESQSNPKPSFERVAPIR
jgi:hypothetical protein